MIYGIPSINIDDDVTDRIGIRTLILSQLWQPTRWPMPLTELDAEAPAVPSAPDGVILIGRQTRRHGGALRTTWTFEGVDGTGTGKSVTFKDRTNSLDYAFEPGFAEVSILRHPRILELMEAYNGAALDGEVLWTPTITYMQLRAAGLAAGAKHAGDQPNPMYGHQTYFIVQGTYTYRYAARDESGIHEGVGQIWTDGLPGQPPKYTDRNWLKAPPVWRRRGTILDITEVYWLSEKGGWNEPLYGLKSLTRDR